MNSSDPRLRAERAGAAHGPDETGMAKRAATTHEQWLSALRAKTNPFNRDELNRLLAETPME